MWMAATVKVKSRVEAKCLGNKNGPKWMAWHALCWPSVCSLSWCRNATAFRMWMLCFWGLNSVQLFLSVCVFWRILDLAFFFSFLCCLITCAFSILCVFSFKKQYFVFKQFLPVKTKNKKEEKPQKAFDWTTLFILTLKSFSFFFLFPEGLFFVFCFLWAHVFLYFSFFLSLLSFFLWLFHLFCLCVAFSPLSFYSFSSSTTFFCQQYLVCIAYASWVLKHVRCVCVCVYLHIELPLFLCLVFALSLPISPLLVLSACSSPLRPRPLWLVLYPLLTTPLRPPPFPPGKRKWVSKFLFF